MDCFTALREDSATLRDNEPYSANRKSGSLHESRRITQFECPTLSEKQLARFYGSCFGEPFPTRQRPPESFLIAGTADDPAIMS